MEDEYQRASLLKKNSTSADIIFGSLSGVSGRIIEHPFDTVKVRLQATKNFKGFFDCVHKTFKTEGLKGFYKGISVPLFGSVLEFGVLFNCYSFFQSKIKYYLTHQAEEETLTSIKHLIFAGSLSGGTVSFLLTPVELIKCNLQVQDVLLQNETAVLENRVRYRGPFNVITTVLKVNGIAGMYRGHLGTFLRESVGCGAWFGSYESVCNLFLKYSTNNKKKKDDLNPLQLMVAGAAAGMTYNAAFFPADVIKSVQQTQNLSNKKGFFQIGSDIYKTQGIKGFFKGFNMTVLRSAPTSAAIFLTYELMTRHLGN
ncbi:hypothetical protein HDU92_001866 [Lobulomyces angularis]|nr:hypothetical protein HDU92_001866 [Lobulomyces angularis]